MTKLRPKLKCHNSMSRPAQLEFELQVLDAEWSSRKVIFSVTSDSKNRF